jgi:hypothetical protein
LLLLALPTLAQTVQYNKAFSSTYLEKLLKTIKKYATLSAQYHKRLKIRDGPREMRVRKQKGSCEEGEEWTNHAESGI